MAEQPRIVIVGAGFGGLAAAKLLARLPADVLVLDRNNYHTFFPLLYQVAAAELEPEDIVFPVRSTLRRQKRVRVLVDEVTGVDMGRKLVLTAHHQFPYDYIILSLGSTPNFFDVEGAATYSFKLRNLEDAINLRNQILFRFERALCEEDEQVRRRMLTFAVVGGGPTGVEFSGALAELIHGPLRKDFPALREEVRLLLLEASDHLLPGLAERLQAYAHKRLGRMGVEVRLGAAVKQVTPHSVTLKDGSEIPSETVIWTAGVRGAPPAQVGDLPMLRNDKVSLLPTLQVPGHPEVYVIGDLAQVEQGGKVIPMVAQGAIQEGESAARNILRQLKGLPPEPFLYNDMGTLAVIGRNAAAVHLFGLDFTGFFAWVLWVGLHIFRLISFRNRLIVLVNWAWDYLFFERGVRLIVPSPGKR